MNRMIKHTLLGFLWVVGLIFAGCDADLSPVVNILGAALIGISSYLSVERHGDEPETAYRHMSELRHMKSQLPISSHS